MLILTSSAMNLGIMVCIVFIHSHVVPGWGRPTPIYLPNARPEELPGQVLSACRKPWPHFETRFELDRIVSVAGHLWSSS